MISTNSSRDYSAHSEKKLLKIILFPSDFQSHFVGLAGLELTEFLSARIKHVHTQLNVIIKIP